MTRKEALTELLEKVKAGDSVPFHGFSDIDLDLFTQGFIDDVQRAYNGSMDAALSLFEAVLPGWYYNIAPKYCHVIPPHDGGDDDASTGYHDTPSRALLIAILEALVGMEDG